MSEINILIVEDESVVAMGLEQDLKKLGYQVSDIVSNGIDAIEMAGEKTPDLVLMDIKLEGEMDGIKAAEAIRKKFMIPVVYLTAYADEETIQRAKITEPYGYIIKPFNERELHSAIEIGIYKNKIEQEMVIKNVAIESSINAIAMGSTDGKITYVNDAFLKTWKYTHPSRIIGRTFDSLWSEGKNPDDLLEAIKNQTQWNGEAHAQRHDGSSFMGQVCIHTVLDDNGLALCWMLTCIDITDKKLFELESIKAKEHLENLLDSASEVILSIDEHGKVSTWNKTAERMTGFNKKEIINRRISKLKVFDDAMDSECMIKNISLGEKAPFDELVLLTKKGAKKIISISYSLINSPVEQKGVLIIGKDITNESEIHNKLISGRSYYVSKDSTDIKILLSNLTHYDYEFLCFVRPHSSFYDFIRTYLDAEISFLSDLPGRKTDHAADANRFISLVHNFCTTHEKPFIILDDIHYFLIRYSFDFFANVLLNFNDIIGKTNALLFVLSEDILFDKKQKTILNQELYTLPNNSIEHTYIDDKIRRMLFFIYEQNQLNASVSFKKLMSEFDIVYATAAKRIEVLEKNNFITIKNSGKAKRMYITEKGKTFLHNVSPI